MGVAGHGEDLADVVDSRVGGAGGHDVGWRLLVVGEPAKGGDGAGVFVGGDVV
jgi:hypothetical protein